MKIKKNTYTYVEKDVQYESYDLTTAETVMAEYIHTTNTLYDGIPFIEALPPPKSTEECIDAYSYNLPFSARDIANLSDYEKMLCLPILQKVRFSLPFAADVEYEFYRALCDSYSSRYQFYDPNNPLFVKVQNENIAVAGKLIADQSSSSVSGFALIGNSGSGKTSTIDMLISHYPQVIQHPDSSSRMTQIVYLVVNCPPNSNFNELYVSIAAEIDKALGITNNYHEDMVAHMSGLAKKHDMIKRLIEVFAIGIIILDEIQQLEFKGIRENTFESLLTLSNETKVAFAAIGTEDAYEKMFPNERTARRVGPFIEASKYCNDLSMFRILVLQLREYYWFDTPMVVTDDILHALYKYSKGIVAHLITIYTYMNMDYIKAKEKPAIDVPFIDSVIQKHFKGLHDLLSSNAKRRKNKATQEEIIATAQKELELQLNKNRQSDFMKQVKQTPYNTDANELCSNIVKNIQTCFNSFQTDDISKAFNKVYSKKKNQSLSEQELTQLVIANLQSSVKPTPQKANKPSPEQLRINLTESCTVFM